MVKKKFTWLLIGILLLIVLLFINNEIYQSRAYIAKAKEAIQEYKYDHATAYLQKADGLFFHKKVQAYLLHVEDKKRESIMAYMKDRIAKEKAFADYKMWLEGEILAPVSTAFKQSGGKAGVEPKPMQNLFYQLNFNVEEKRINLNEDYLEIHQYLSEYIQKNQIAYSYWVQKKPTEAEKVRQEAIKAHTNFMIAFNAYTNNHCDEKIELMPHYY